MSDLTIKERLIMTPGPVSIDPRVSQAMSNRILGQFDSDFLTIMDDTMELTRQAFKTKNKWAFAVDGSGRAGLEALMSNIISKGDKVLVPVLGRFGNLGIELAQRAGGEVITM
ncbi:alanine--glyoxylate aminotransferase family protein [Limosilactobacillus fermentum]|uniref:alanine--glyoxylate aminotransferase family protein n=1 Tax=Limosilactobacillus fermentum TaxID=1613 RepID=UPI003B9816E5